MKVIIIANIAEAFENSINKISSNKKKLLYTQVEHSLCERALLLERDDKVIITPFFINQKLFDHNKNVLGYKNIKNLFPQHIDISLSDAIKQDKKLLNELYIIIKENPQIEISPYAITEKFISLIDLFKSQGLNFIIRERPLNNEDWLVSYLDSKVGSRTEINKIIRADIFTPESIICTDKKHAMNIALWFYKNDKSCVIKSNFGESGWGLIFVYKNQFNNIQECIFYIMKKFGETQIWDKDLILVEEYINSKNNTKIISPSSELFISDKEVLVTYVCNQILSLEGTFQGIAVGRVFSQATLRKIKKISLQIGSKFKKLGYRGIFDIDFVLSNKDDPYVIETNMRKTGGTHVYDVLKFLLGNNWENKIYAFSNDNFKYGNRILNAEEILYKLQNILYPMYGEAQGVIISIINKWEPKLGFIIIGKSKDKAFVIYNKMLDIFNLQNN